mmetsp:Transcript_18333/g.56456  ORF Transcript_18333/g.56456 Transcript_18333/m.56456 type:complete len:250 (-) Transcript_18333:114-863(-)
MPVRRVHLPAAHDGPLHFQQTRGRVHPLAVVERAAPLAARAVEDGQPAVRAGVREQFRLLAFVRARGREEPRLVGLGAHGAAAPHQDAQRVVEHVRAAVAVARGGSGSRPPQTNASWTGWKTRSSPGRVAQRRTLGPSGRRISSRSRRSTLKSCTALMKMPSQCWNSMNVPISHAASSGDVSSSHLLKPAGQNAMGPPFARTCATAARQPNPRPASTSKSGLLQCVSKNKLASCAAPAAKMTAATMPSK